MRKSSREGLWQPMMMTRMRPSWIAWMQLQMQRMRMRKKYRCAAMRA